MGGVFRCKPDGSGFEVVARGLRNSCGLCFDSDFNLFTNIADLFSYQDGVFGRWLVNSLLYSVVGAVIVFSAVLVLLAGLVIGALGRLAVPGPDPMPIWVTVLLESHIDPGTTMKLPEGC